MTNGEREASDTNPLLPNNQSDNRVNQLEHFVRRKIGHILCILIVFVILSILIISSFLPDSPVFPRDRYGLTVKSGLSDISMAAGRKKCEMLRSKPDMKMVTGKNRVSNPRAVPEQNPLLIRNAVIWDGEGHVLNDMDIYIKDGVIQQISEDIELTNDQVKVIDVAGHIVSPGLVDMHSHLGLYSWPSFNAKDDVNEETQPLTPFLRSLDAFDPSDNGIRIVSSGGVTTALVLPGSGNLMGGEGYAFKLRPVSTLSAEDMLVQANIDPRRDIHRRWMKMACGENPKKVYGRRGEMPSTRLGESYLVRKELARAQALKQEQDDWCFAASQSQSRFDSPFPEDLTLESLVSLLRGEVLLNIHCYETHDIEAMIRHSLEFNFTISAFHHALDAYRIPEIIHRAPNNITIATFADSWGYKKEAFQGIPQAPKILFDAGIPLALKSDHPVTNAQHLAFEAAKATHYGLPQQEAFKAITSTPANAIGLGHRIGSLKVGYDADLVIWDREPLELGASPLQVIIDGVPIFEDHPIQSAVLKKGDISEGSSRVTEEKNKSQMTDAKSFILNNARYSFLGPELKEGPIQLVVKEGSIICIGVDCSSSIVSIESTQDVPLPEYDIQGGYILPGLIGVGSSLGLIEIKAEPTTGDGIGSPSRSTDPNDIIKAVDGIKLGTRHLEEAFKGGVMTVITAPMSNNVVMGISTAFKTRANSLLTEGALISSVVALHLQIGDSVKSGVFPTVSSQISYIRNLLKQNIRSRNHYGQAARGEIPTVIIAHNEDEIASLIMLKRDHLSNIRLVIQGGAEAYLVATHLAEYDIPVILKPALCTPSQFDSIHCLTGSPLTNGTAAHVLHSHGVKLGIGISNDGFARNLAWDAGWLSVTSPESDLEGGTITETAAIQFITTNIQDIYGLSSTSSSGNEFIVYSGHPFDMNSRITLIHSQNGGIETF
ncbi:hypothetical protein BDB01DRAFT_718349 [Pilobolus umbonatus]|nr:hypothetical protein BDB01DRAFT_718349 [Pilobolus umbonatus]